MPPVASLSEAWLLALERCASSPKARTLHLVMTVTEPGPEVERIRRGVDEMLRGAEKSSVDTVAQTIFPWPLYDDPGISWHPDLPEDVVEKIDSAASNLYGRYISMLPVLLTDPANRRGTYFSRMTNWPGRQADGTNQLKLRIAGLRRERRNRRFTNNTLDIDLSADCLDVTGTQVYAVTDKRSRGFPCLVHLSFTLFNGTLNCTAVYRHHLLMTKAYGNLVGLSHLMRFLCQQTGFNLGELVINATLADGEPSLKPKRLIADLREPPLLGASRGLR